MKSDTDAKLEFCTMADIGMEITGEDSASVVESLNEYLKAFAKPNRVRDGNVLQGGFDCIKCGKPTSGVMGTFTWGIAHGEGFCQNCNWPARAYHRPKDKDGEEIFNRPLEFILQYHPDSVTQQGDEHDEPTD